jgi:hypothetical protein
VPTIDKLMNPEIVDDSVGRIVKNLGFSLQARRSRRGRDLRLIAQ